MSNRNLEDTTTRPAVFRLPDGEPVNVRPIRPHDADALRDFFRGLSGQSRRNRFLGAVNELPPCEIARFAGMDQPDQLALVAFVGRDRYATIIAEAIYVIAPKSTRCEFAVSVTDAWQRRGLGTLLLRLVECRARLTGARHLFGDVLCTNDPMKGFARAMGFLLRSPVTDARLVEVVKDLGLPQIGTPCNEQFAQLPPLAA